MLISGKQIKAWRKTAGLEQKEVAKKLGISNSTLCRIEMEDRAITGKLLELIPSLMSLDLTSDSVIATAAGQLATAEAFESKREKERLRIEKLKNLQDINTLTDIGNTYRYRDFIVVPSQYYARWSGQDTKRVNETIDRIAEQGRLEIGEHFFKLNFEETRDFIKKEPFDLDANDIKFGLVLITFSAVNRLTHHFRDPVSVAQSNYITDTYTSLTDKPRSFVDVISTVDNPYEKFALLSDMCKKISEHHLAAMKTSEQFQVLSKKQTATELIVEANKVELDTKIEATVAKVDAHKVQLETKIEETKAEVDARIVAADADIQARLDASPFSCDQLAVIDELIRQKRFKYDDVQVASYIRGLLKTMYFPKHLVSGKTYNLIPARHFTAVKQIISTWEPCDWQLEQIAKRKGGDKTKPKSKSKSYIVIDAVQDPPVKKPPVCPDCGSMGVQKVVVAKAPYPFWSCDRCKWSVGLGNPFKIGGTYV